MDFFKSGRLGDRYNFLRVGGASAVATSPKFVGAIVILI